MVAGPEIRRDDAMTAAGTTAPSSAAHAAVDAIRIEAIEEAADLAISFLVGLRQAARDGDTVRLDECLRALRLAAQVMRKAYRELSDPRAGS